MHKYKLLIIAIVVFALGIGLTLLPEKSQNTPSKRNTTVLSVDQAFNVSAAISPKGNALLEFNVAPNYFLYKERLFISATPANAINIKQIDLPHTLSIPDINDPNKLDEVFAGSFTIDIPLDHKKPLPKIHVKLQGCNGQSICYPPQTYTFDLLSVPTQNMAAESVNRKPSVFQEFSRFYHGEVSGQSLLNSLNLVELVLIFFIAGFAISLTPCTYPLYPIALSSIIGSKDLKKKNILLLVHAYIHGIALIYVLMGFFAAFTGKLLMVLLQTPAMMLISAGMCFILGMAMFDFIEIKLPNSLHSYLHHHSVKIKGGGYVRVFVMGILSSILLGPCVTPPLIAAIGFIASRGDVILGGICLYAISLGMGVPILILSLLGGRLMPRSGKWMNSVKYFMGIVLILFSAYLVAPYINMPHIKSEHTVSSYNKIITVENSKQLEIAIQKSNKPVLIDFYASWCAICKEMEQKTFTDKKVQIALDKYTVIKFDLTKNEPDQISVLKQYGLYGPPALILILPNKKAADTMLGFVSSEDLIQHLSVFRK